MDEECQRSTNGSDDAFLSRVGQVFQDNIQIEVAWGLLSKNADSTAMNAFRLALNYIRTQKNISFHFFKFFFGFCSLLCLNVKIETLRWMGDLQRRRVFTEEQRLARSRPFAIHVPMCTPDRQRALPRGQSSTNNAEASGHLGHPIQNGNYSSNEKPPVEEPTFCPLYQTERLQTASPFRRADDPAANSTPRVNPAALFLISFCFLMINDL